MGCWARDPIMPRKEREADITIGFNEIVDW